jgi:hypothetical protein
MKICAPILPYLSEENAPRCIAFFAEQIAYLADLGERVNGRTIV